MVLTRRLRPTPAPVRAAILLIFALAMGWLEAVVVVYIRTILGIQAGAGLPSSDEVLRRMQALPWLVPVEQTREAATIVMLAAAAALAGRGMRSRLGAFLACFGAWDLFYYVGLRALIGWPPSLDTKDLLFLIPPHPWWYQPVWVPVGIACVMLVVGLALFSQQPLGPALALPFRRRARSEEIPPRPFSMP